jgi:HK97 family phage prohead protease
MIKPNENTVEKRGFSDAEIRMGGDDKNPIITGYAAKFNTRSRNLGGFVEVIKPGAFDNVLNDDVRALFNHDSNIVLGRTSSGTLKLTVDDVGLRYEISPPDSQTVKDLVIEPLKRGDINQSSFAFRVMSDGQQWDEDEDGMYVRSITKVSSLADVCPVTYPAYDDTEAAARSLDSHMNKQTEIEQRGLTLAREQSHRDKYLTTI